MGNGQFGYDIWLDDAEVERMHGFIVFALELCMKYHITVKQFVELAFYPLVKKVRRNTHDNKETDKRGGV